MFIAVDGEPLRAEGRIQRVTMHAQAGLNMLTRTMEPGPVNAEITVTLRQMHPAVEEVERDTVAFEGPRGTVLVIREEGRDALPPGT